MANINPTLPKSLAVTSLLTESGSVTGPIPPSLSEEIVHLYRGWHQYEGISGGPAIVDFDLSDLRGQSSFSSRAEILPKLEGLKARVAALDSHESTYLESRLGGSIMYLRALMGEQVPFHDYVGATLGIPPEPIPAHEIGFAKSNVEDLLSELGLDYTASSSNSLDQSFFTDPEQIKHEILRQKDIWLARLADAGIPVPGLLPLVVKFDEVDAYWSNWIDGSSHRGLILTINLHKRARYNHARALALCLHEICGHAVQMSILREQIKLNKLSQACGVTTVHSPEAFVAEGLGQTVAELLDDYDFPIAFRINRAVRYHTLLVLHNAHIDLYNGTSVSDLIRDLRQALPFSMPEELVAQLRDRGTNLLYRSYLLSYSAGERTIRKLIRDGVNKRELFKALYTVPMTPEELLKRI